ncbi:MAG: DUF5667 domain-containing protein [bacterium]
MTEKELIQKLQKLSEIKPREEWVLLAKERMFAEKEIVAETIAREEVLTVSWDSRVKEVLDQVFRTLKYRSVMATVTSFALLLTVVGFSQNSLPGDSLYVIKKITEQARVQLASRTEKPKVQLELVEKRLTELAMIAEANMGKNLAPAIEELEKTAKESAARINEMDKVDKETVASIEAIQAKTKTIEDTLAVKIDTNDLKQSANSYYQTEVEQQIADLEGRTLTAEQAELLTEAKKYYEEGNYSKALELIYLSGNSVK